MTATAIWILKDRATQRVLWQKEGMAPPEIVVDHSTYQNVFSTSFPDITITWGPGKMDMHIVSPDAVYKVGSVAVFRSLEVVLGGGPVQPVDHIETSAHVVQEDAQSEAHRVLGSTGLPPGLKLEEGIPQAPPMPEPLAGLRMAPVPTKTAAQQVGEDLGLGDLIRQDGSRVKGPDIRPVVLDPADKAVLIRATPDTPVFITMMLNFKAKLLKADRQWPDRLEALPEFVRLQVEADPEGMLVNDDDAWTGIFTKGTQQLDTHMDYESFLVDDGDFKTRTFINWVKGFMTIERMCAPSEPKQPDYEYLFRIALEMFEDATVLYLHENGWSPYDVDPQPMGTVYTDILREMEARVQFLKSKDLEYGQPTRRQGVNGVLTRIWDKIARYANLKANPGLLPKFESMADSAKDLGGYSAILAGLLQECLEETNPSSKWCNPNLVEKKA